MTHFDSLISNFIQEGRKPKAETFSSKNFNLSKIESSLEKAKEGFMALANVKWLGNLKPEKVEQVFNAVIEQLGKDDNVSYESVKKSIDFALSKNLPATNAGKWSRQFRNWIENLQDIQSSGVSSTENDTGENAESENDTEENSPETPKIQSTSSQESENEDAEVGAELELSDFQQSLYDILLNRKESGKGSIRGIDLLSMVNIPFNERDRGQAYLNNELKVLKDKKLIRPVGGGAWEAIEKASATDAALEPDEADMDQVARDEFARMTRGNLDRPRNTFQSDWDGGGREAWGEDHKEDTESGFMMESFIHNLKKID